MKDLLDRKFVITAIVLAGIYITIVILVNNFLGKEAAGIAGVALTALATAIFKQFERLRFVEQADDAILVNWKFSWWQVLVLSIFFAGINLYLQEIKDVIVPYIGETMVANEFESTSPDWTDIGHVIIEDRNLYINHYSVWEKGVECFAFFIGSWIAAIAWPKISYSVIIIGSLIGVVADFLREDLILFFAKIYSWEQLADQFDVYQYSFLYIICAIIGSYFGLPSRRNGQINATGSVS